MNLAGQFWITYFQLPQPVPASYFQYQRNRKGGKDKLQAKFNQSVIEIFSGFQASEISVSEIYSARGTLRID
jgi:hypothetical protein